MEVKKSPNADLENKKLSFTLIGLVIVLAIVYIALEWTQRDVIVYEDSSIVAITEDEDVIPVTIQDQTPPPPPQEQVAPPPVVVDIEIVDNTQNTGDHDFGNQNNNDDIAPPPPPPPPPPPIEEDIDENTVFVAVEKMPSFKGGDAALKRYLANETNYPKISQENGVQGKVYVSFVVGRQGEITNVEIMKGVDRYLDAEAIRVVQKMPSWNPGEQRGKAVKVKYVLPITFKL